MFLFNSHWVCYRAVKACHVLVSGNGRIKLSGNRNLISMINSEQRTRKVHDFPKHDTQLLPWLSPEILQQVSHTVIV